jgi:ribosomal protein S18 acetylase RimI-like enzyme
VRGINNKILASILFYFNDRDIIEKTIHLGFIAVSKDTRNTGIGSKILKYAINDLKTRTNVRGISSRVTISNLASLNLHLKNGFEIVEEYFDNERGEKRAYLILKFKD